MLINDFLNLLKFRFKEYSVNIIGIFFVSIYIFLFIKNFNIRNDHILNIADKIESHYGKSHYKTYAMGDMAGKSLIY